MKVMLLITGSLLLSKMLVNALSVNEGITKELLSNNILQSSFFKFNFSIPELLEIDMNDDNLGVEYSGMVTNLRLQRMFEKALQGETVTLLVMGGSCTIGADLGAHSKSQTYHAAFSSWWNEKIFPITGSYLHKKVVAIGGIGSAYMNFCWKQYILDKSSFDLVFWEFFINDFYFEEYSLMLENFIKSILNYDDSASSLVLVKFSTQTTFPGDQLTCLVTDKQYNMKDQVVRQICQQLQISAVNMQELICQNIHKYNRILMKDDYFVQSHPSHKAHAQIGFILINYVRQIFAKFIRSPTTSKSSMMSHLPHQEEKKIECFTGLFPYANSLKRTLFDVPLLWSNGYRRRTKYKWDQSVAERTDIRGGYIAKEPQSSITFQLSSKVVSKLSNIYLVISHQKSTYLKPNFYINVIVRSVYGDFASSFDCSQLLHPASSVQRIASNVFGTCNIEVYDPTGLCLLNAIVVEESSSSKKNKIYQV